MASSPAGRPNTQRTLDALNSPVRREILWLIWERELPAGEITSAFDLSAPTISEHLMVLREAGLVTLRRAGTFRLYKADRDAVQGLHSLLQHDKHKWFPGTTPASLAPARTVGAVIIEVEAPCSQPDAFRAFTNPAVYSRWVGVPVTLVEGRFSATMEWGLEVRGAYEHVVEPELIIMMWDFEPEMVPVPGGAYRAYLRFSGAGSGCHLELTQLVSSVEQATYMERAWGLILGRFRDNVVASLEPQAPLRLRPQRQRSKPASLI
jgi:DNA-binding transcriptional ArsR family regulator/uncharacterized protein YndB with AHSA1/START domain